LRCRGVRNANAYILVYDICCVESFEYVKMIRQQIVENRYGRAYLLLRIESLTYNLLTLTDDHLKCFHPFEDIICSFRAYLLIQHASP